MRIGIVGDIHGNFMGLREALREMGAIDELYFTGDGYRDILQLQKLYQIPVLGVAGNCDIYSEYPEEEFIDLFGYKIWLTHGHIYEVKSGLTRLALAGQAVKADLIVFGHTHEPLVADWQGMKLLNPGSLSRERSLGRPSYGMIQVDESGLKTERRYLPIHF